jgi:hypothetical protein
MAMIPYPELVAALSNWRARKGLPVEQRAEYLSPTPSAAAAPRAMPISAPPARAAAAAAPAAAAYGTVDDDAIDDGDLDIVAEDDAVVGDSTDMLERARTAAQGMDEESTAIAGEFGGGDEQDPYAAAGTMDVDDDEVLDEDVESGELGGGPPPLAPPPGDDDDDNPWK